ncbi:MULTISPECIES: ABC transporter permease [unclassified Tatumella]|uniref:ABC transporter permease n=1 Tax=unclassified Tatumella TaxID=2649542 RepID=UPI001BAF5351|nr:MULTISPECIES: ABC transporter permease [unclassified Tatumella]MBS0877740.1 ABC transporter permease [Tatumella sp. JGM82]MBS0891471.1 ABC transporter permease [Tatumella sp. JGM94]MBS0902375.1 ABC transporter permease [Tatumella sp. JGM100]
MFKNYKELFSDISKYKSLLFHLTRRDITSKFKGSYAGLAWSFLNPLLLLSVYTFVFSVIMKAKWGLQHEGNLDFAIVLFAGLIVFNMYAEATNRAATIFNDNKNYVKKVVFPLNILPMVIVNSSFFTGLISYIILLVALIIFKDSLHPECAIVIVLLLPIYLMTLGVTYFISAISVFVRDVGQVIAIFNMAFMFLSPIFFPMERMPKKFQAIASYNPIAYIVTQVRDSLIFERGFNWDGYFIATLTSLVIFAFGFWVFSSLKKDFADVI